MIFWQYVTATLVALVSLAYAFVKYRRSFWLRKGIPAIKPSFVFGSELDLILTNRPFLEFHHEIYRELAPHKFGGYFNFLRPILVVRDPELVKHVLAMDFEHFVNRSTGFSDKNEPLSLHLFNLENDEWRNLRAKLTPTFTTGKIKLMFELMKVCADEMVESLMTSEDIFDAKELMSRYTTDVISSCAFGLNGNAVADPNSEFRLMGKKIVTPSLKTRVRTIISFISPKLRKLLGLKVIDEDVTNFILGLVKSTIEYREKNNVQRNDFLDLLIGLKKENAALKKKKSKVELTIESMAAQVFIFYVAGFETSSAALSFALVELARNPQIQRKLIAEVVSVVEKHNGQVTYDAIKDMRYMDQVVEETMRMYPALPVLFRTCNKKYRIPGTNKTIEKGQSVFIPVYGLHYDVQYWETPYTFNPEHFSYDAKAKRHNYVWLPFGEGPRICIGSRFGLMQVKLGLASLLLKYEFQLSNKMKFPIEYVGSSVLTMSKHGLWLKAVKKEEK